MEPQMIDHYNEIPHNVNVIEKMNMEFSKLQSDYKNLKNKLEKLKDKKHNEPILLSLYNHYCKSHREYIDVERDDWGNIITENKLKWFHKYSHILEELDVADMEHWMSEYWGWVHSELIDDENYSGEEDIISVKERSLEMLAEEALDFEKSLREKAESVMVKQFDPEYKTRLYSCDEVMDGNYMYH